MTCTRRQMLAACAAALPALHGLAARAAADAERQRLGLVTYSYSLRVAADRGKGAAGFGDPLVFLEHAHQVGAGGVQVGLGTRDAAFTAKLREKLDAYRMVLEGIARLPQEPGDADRFDAELRTAREAGATVVRTVLTSGRRYEAYASMAAFRQAADRAYQALTRAEPVAARHGVRLAVENHKDWRTGELLDLLRRLGSRHVGVCVDTGNSIALLEDPQEVVAAYAPLAFSVHLKDMAVAEYEDGFLLSEVPLGEGILDLPKVVATLRQAHPEVRFNLEMITRDPLKVPCLTPQYWATSEDLPGRYLARTLTLVRRHAGRPPLPRVTGLDPDRQLAAEDENVRRSLAYAGRKLDL